MNWITIIGYAVLIISQILVLQAIIIALIGGVIGNISRNYLLGILLGAVIVWAGISLLWKYFLGYDMPFLAFVISMTFQILHRNVSNSELNENAKKAIVGEIWGILIVAIYTLFFAQFNWY